jgi:predicted RNase H-like HicB family nuclease
MNPKIVIELGEDSGFIAYVPSLRGCWSQGATRRKALANIWEAIDAWLETEQCKSKPSRKARRLS